MNDYIICINTVIGQNKEKRYKSKSNFFENSYKTLLSKIPFDEFKKN